MNQAMCSSLNNQKFTHVSISLENYKEEIVKYIQLYGLNHINADVFIRKINMGLTDNMSSLDLARYCSETAAAMVTQHPEYEKLSAVILMTYHSSVTLPSFSAKIILINQHCTSLDPELYKIVLENRDIFDSMVDYSRDFDLSYFAIHSLLRSYMMRVNNEPIERPQDIFLRTAIQMNRNDFQRVKETYDLISLGFYTHGTPTLFNSMYKNCQLASCFLINPKGDDISSIFQTIGDCAMISKHSGGLGMSLHEIRCAGSPLLTSGGFAKGIVPIIRIINETMKYVNQGGNRRQSSIAFYLEPWHKDIFDFLDLRKNTGSEEFRARDIFTALWMNDLFMERVESDGEWSLFDPNQARSLCNCWGEDFKKLYLKYEKTLSRTVIRAQTLWKAIIIAQIETGTPYIVYKDTANRLSNQQHLGTIKSSNLCAEIIEYSAKDECAVCNLASICLKKFVINGTFDFERLRSVVRIALFNLNKNIDASFYPIIEAKNSNLRHRPVGIGVQGLADVFVMMRYPFESDHAKNLNKLIFETIYFSAVEASVELAMTEGPYESFQGSPLSKGVFHHEMFGAQPSGLWDWDELRVKLLKYGARNSLFVSPMPTAGTSQIFSNNECFEPFTSNIYTRRTIAGEFQCVNQYLMNDLLKLGIWNNDIRNVIIEHEGSIQYIPGIPNEIKELYKTVWEVKMKNIIDMAADRQAFVDQSQSLNIYLQQPTYSQLSSMHFYGWKKQLKTGMYYLRTRPITNAVKFTVNQELVEKTLSSLADNENSRGDQDKNGVCESCSC
jgi:ribonucleoside-diphosphate reductase subunit M1